MITVGTDPEIFLRSKTTKQFVSASDGYFPGTKWEPFPLRNGAMQVDGHALEFNTKPVSNEDDFVAVVTDVFGQVKEFVGQTDSDLELVLEPVAHFEADYFQKLPSFTKQLGCDPDYSTETGEIIPAPQIADIPVRTGSGHIHIGWTADEDVFDPVVFRQRLEIAQRMNPYLLRTSAKWETLSSQERRRYYGRQGSFRPKSYGVELRVLDNLWLADETRMREVFRAATQGFEIEFKELSNAH